MNPSLDERKRAGQKVSLIGALVNTVMSLLKIIGGLFSGSAALVADGFHSLSDVITDLMVVFLLGVSHKKADTNHPYGHGRFETLGTVALAFVLLSVAGFMAWDSLRLLFAGEIPSPPGVVALFIAGISILANEVLFFYTLRVGEKIQSRLLIANAWHHRSDSLSSVVVLIAIAGAILGVWWLDALAAVLVALLIAKIGWELLSKSLAELVDTALPPERLTTLRETVMSVDGVLGVHSFKTRSMGGQSLLEMHVQVAPHLSAAEGHYIGDYATRLLQERFDDIAHIIYHIDTYDDHAISLPTRSALPARTEIHQHLDAALARILGETPDYELIIYYTPSFIELDIKCPIGIFALLEQQGIAAAELEARLSEELRTLDWFKGIQIWLPAR